MIKQFAIAILICFILVGCKTQNEEENVIKETFKELIGEKYFKRDVFKLMPGFIENSLENQDYEKLYQLDSVLHPLKISNIINEPEKTDSVIETYYKNYYDRIEWLRNNNDSLDLIVFLNEKLSGINIEHLKSFFNSDTLNQEISEILIEIPLTKTKSKNINLHGINIGRFEINHQIEKYSHAFENGLEINPFKGYREIGYMEISRVLFNKNQNIAIYFVTKLLYHDSCIEMIIVKKENNVWNIKEKIKLKE